MISLILNSHSKACKNKYCLEDLDADVFFFNNQFVFLETPFCLRLSDQDGILKIIKRAISENEDRLLWDVAKSYNLDSKFRSFRNRGQKLELPTKEINYIYSCNAGKKYAVVTEKPFDKIINSNEVILKDFKKLSSWIVENRPDERHLIEKARNIATFNIYDVSDSEVVKSVEHMRKLITKNK